MKPGEHPDFFQLAPPPGTSRESTIRLDADGKFWHNGARVNHPTLEKALHGWIARHPEDGRFILTNGYDWTYFEVEDAPYEVRSLSVLPDAVVLRLSDETDEPLDPTTLRVGGRDALYTKVKGGAFDARFSRHAQTSLSPWLGENDGVISLRFGSDVYPLV